MTELLKFLGSINEAFFIYLIINSLEYVCLWDREVGL